jgi:hypothetical protein
MPLRRATSLRRRFWIAAMAVQRNPWICTFQPDAITKRLSDMTDAELTALEARMITIPATLALEHADERQVDGDTDGSQSDTDAEQDTDGCADEVA